MTDVSAADGVTPQAITDMMALQQRSHDALLEQERRRARKRLDAAVAGAKLDTAALIGRQAYETYAQGAFPVRVLENDPYRDTRATLAEARTNTLALKLTLDAVEYTYDVEGVVKGRYRDRRISRHFDSLDEARAFFSDAADRFFRVSDFRTLVDF